MSEQTIEPLVVLGLGANLGNPLETLAGVLKEIGKLPQTELVAVSPFYKTAPVDSSGPDYVNAVCAVKTALAPQELLDELQRLENLHGRVRPAGVRNAPRTLDLDVLLWGSQTICTGTRLFRSFFPSYPERFHPPSSGGRASVSSDRG